MKRHRGAVTGHAVAAFLLFEPSFPRSVRHAVEMTYQTFTAIRPPSEHQLPGGRSFERIAMLTAFLAEESPSMLAEGRVHDIVTHVVDETAVIASGLAHDLFGYDPGLNGPSFVLDAGTAAIDTHLRPAAERIPHAPERRHRRKVPALARPLDGGGVAAEDARRRRGALAKGGDSRHARLGGARGAGDAHRGAARRARRGGGAGR